MLKGTELHNVAKRERYALRYESTWCEVIEKA